MENWTNNTEVASPIEQLKQIIKTYGSELQGQEEAAYTHVFWPT